MTSLTDDDLARQRARNDEIGRAGLQWVERKRAEIDKLPVGTVVIFDIDTGDYITGPDYLVASDDFHAKYGEDTPGFVHEVGRPIFVGGGLYVRERG